MSTSAYIKGAKIVIVGAGALGSALAYRLAQAGAVVTVIERAHPGAGTTGRSFAWLNGMDKPPREYHRLNVLSIRDHEDLADELGGTWVHVTGSVHWAEAGGGARAAALEQSVRQMLGWGARVDRLTPEEAMRELEPDLLIDPATVDAVYFVNRAGWLDPMAMAHGALTAAVERYGATLIHGDVSGVAMAGDMIESLTLADGRTIPADVVINAAGPDAAWIAKLAGSVLPMERTPGLLIVTAPAPARLYHVVYGPEVHMRPEGGGRVMIQWEPLDSDAADGPPPPRDGARIFAALDHAVAVLPKLAGIEVEAVRLGLRPVPKDGYPVIGFDASVGNLYHMVTHSGITLAARLALLVTEELTGGDTALLEPYRPGRFAAGRTAFPGIAQGSAE